MSTSKEAREEIVRQIGALLHEYATVCNMDRIRREVDESLPEDLRDKVNIEEPVAVMGWALCMEYESTSMMAGSYTGTAVVRPEDQIRSTSRGLFEMGAGAFT